MSATANAPLGTTEQPSVAAPAQSAPAEKPKNLAADQKLLQPCCVCKDEKTARDDCMLFSKTDDPAKECQSMIEKYKSCMLGFGFKV